MPLTMALGGHSTGDEVDKSRQSIVYALKALAVIRVHDSEEAQEAKLTIPKICSADPYMKSMGQELVSYLFRTFGRQCAPCMTSYLLGTGRTEEEINQTVSKMEAELRSTLKL